MGVVYLALDERLGRQVAIKRILPERTAGDNTPEVQKNRQRLWREAQLAASLGHPAIVQIHDVLSLEDDSGETIDYIVMEYVEGPSLRQLLRDEKLPLRKLLLIARDLAEGLAEAHDRGVIHRDLKSDNILLTAQRKPKISDFGIAKRALPEPDEEQLTATRHVVGTPRMMAPEQARGGAVDHRCDLFALGVLLYEAFAGVSPFADDSKLATLGKVLTYDPPPVQQQAPEVPAELSGLIQHLLQKEPELRPQSAHEVVQALDEIIAATGSEATATGPATLTFSTGQSSSAGETLLDGAPPTHGGAPPPAASGEAGGAPQGRRQLPSHSLPSGSVSQESSAGPRSRWKRLLPLVAVLLVAAVATGTFLASQRQPELLYAAVPEPSVNQQDGLPEGEREVLQDAVRFAALRTLISLDRVVVKPPEEVDAATGDSLAEIARQVGASTLLTSELECRAQSCRISLHRVGADGALTWADSFEVPREELRLLAAAVETYTRQAFDRYRQRRDAPQLAAGDEELRIFLELHRRAERENEPPDQLLAQLRDLRQRQPRFLEAYLLEADVARRAFHASRDRQLVERARRLLNQAQELAPSDPRIPALAFTVELTVGDTEQADQELDELRRLAPGDVTVSVRQAMLLEVQGRPDEALKELRTAVQRRPSVSALSNLAAMEYRQGKIEDARGSLQLLLARSPDSVQGRSQLALLELVDGDPARAAELYQTLAEENQGIAELSNLGLAYLLAEDYGRAADAFRRVYEEQPSNPQVVLNYADARSLLGEEEEARALYRQVVELVEGDVDSGSAAFLTVKAQALAHLDQQRPAVAAVQQALQLAPRDSQVAYEAAVVYSLAGDFSSAVVSAQRALELGYGARWFAFPWFDQLRQDPELRPVLEAASPP